MKTLFLKLSKYFALKHLHLLEREISDCMVYETNARLQLNKVLIKLRKLDKQLNQQQEEPDETNSTPS